MFSPVFQRQFECTTNNSSRNGVRDDIFQSDSRIRLCPTVQLRRFVKKNSPSPRDDLQSKMSGRFDNTVYYSLHIANVYESRHLSGDLGTIRRRMNRKYYKPRNYLRITDCACVVYSSASTFLDIVPSRSEKDFENLISKVPPHARYNTIYVSTILKISRAYIKRPGHGDWTVFALCSSRAITTFRVSHFA